jgi:hypothetical protein
MVQLSPALDGAIAAGDTAFADILTFDLTVLRRTPTRPPAVRISEVNDLGLVPSHEEQACFQPLARGAPLPIEPQARSQSRVPDAAGPLGVPDGPMRGGL